MRELSLFSGAGGGLLGTKLLGWEHAGYVEYNDYCQRIIRQRIDDGILDEAPIFGDIRTFISEGYAESYQGMVDVVTAGFPCQPFSVAGKQAGEGDPRNMWPETIDVIRRVRPRYALLENVPGLLSHTYARRIFGDLAESGFDAKWRVLSAAELGAPHKRDRIFILANSKIKSIHGGEDVRAVSELQKKQSGDGDCEAILPNANLIRSSRPWWAIDPSYSTEEEYREINRTFNGSRWGIESPICRVANGVADRMDRLKSIGNGQVSAVVRAAWELLND